MHKPKTLQEKTIKKSWKKRWKNRAAARHFPSSPPCQECLTMATRNISFCSPAVHPQLMPEAQADHPGAPGQAESRGHLGITPSAVAGLEFHFFPALFPLTGHRPVLLGQASRSSVYKTLATLFFSPLFHSSKFYGVHYLCTHFSFTEIQQINLEFWHIST